VFWLLTYIAMSRMRKHTALDIAGAET